MWAECLLRQTGPSRLRPDQGKSPILARSTVAVCNEQMAMAIYRKERQHFLPLPPLKWGGSQCRFFMEYKDWRKSPDKRPEDSEQEPPKVRKYYGKKFEDYISEQIREAEARGEFDNLQGAGKPLNLDSNV